MNRSNNYVRGLAIGLTLAASAAAQIVPKTGVITVSETWAPPAVYELQGQVYFAGGATLTIQPGTVIFGNGADDALIIACGSVIECLGTKESPVIFTSDADRTSWTPANPRGQYRCKAANEWGNLTILGPGYASCCQFTNSSTPAATNECVMEAVLNVTPNPGGPYAGKPLNRYGGGDDNFDSGTLKYAQFRYGGFTTAPGVELNGISIGGVGRNTEMHHIEVINNLDDGIEIWGGTVNLTYFSVINVGDDSIDLDQGYRGCIQFGLIVQGYANNGNQEAGYGDNAFEIDGAESCWYKPVTQCKIANVTVLGMEDPAGNAGSDLGMALRDNANAQFSRMIFMRIDDLVLGPAGTAGTVCGFSGYGCNSTPTYASRWTTAYNDATAGNQGSGLSFRQWEGNLIDIRDSIFFDNNNAAAYSAPGAPVGVLSDAARSNFIVTANPITGFTVETDPACNHPTLPGKLYRTVNPLPATNDARFAALPVDGSADPSGFMSQVRFRGGFPAGNQWLSGWSASGDFGIVANAPGNCLIGTVYAVPAPAPFTGSVWGGSTTQGAPVHFTDGNWVAGTPVTIRVENLKDLGGFSIAANFFGFAAPFLPGVPLPFGPGLLACKDDVISVIIGAAGSAALPTFVMPAGFSGSVIGTQWLSIENLAPIQTYFSNAQTRTLP